MSPSNIHTVIGFFVQKGLLNVRCLAQLPADLPFSELDEIFCYLPAEKFTIMMPPSAAQKFRVTLAAITWLALLLQLGIMIGNAPTMGMTRFYAILRFLHFFTILSNLLVALALTLQAFLPLSAMGRFAAQPTVMAALAVYIFMVGLVYNTVLRPLWNPQGWQWVADNLLHVLVPLAFVLFWWKTVPKGFVKPAHPVKWLLFPLLYLVYAMLRGALENFYPYPFLDLKAQSAEAVATNCLLIMLVFVALGYILYGLDRRLSKKSSESSAKAATH